MIRQVFFVAGTDTDVGKTFVACQFLQQAMHNGLRALGLKPLAAGAQQMPSGLRNSDALLLQQASSVKLPYAQVNPFCFVDAIAPHLAAQRTGVSFTAMTIADSVRTTLAATDFDYALIEGAGGWRVPLNDDETLADVVRLLDIPVVLVVGMKLGCLNHALLTAEAITRDGLSLAGWVANDLGRPMENLAENIATLEQWLPAPRWRMDRGA